MKKVKYLAMLLAAGMFAACSDNLEDTGAGNAGGTTPATGEGYVKVAINMPTTSGGMSRADESFDDGLDTEYAVYNCIIAFFEGTDEDNATFKKAYTANLNNGTDGNDQVTSRYVCINKAPFLSTSTNTMYALVILNNNGQFKVSNTGNLTGSDAKTTILEEGEKTKNKLSVLKNAITLSAGQTLETYSNSNKDGGFLMTNSPLSDTPGNSQDLVSAKSQTLVPVTVYDSETEANGNNAANIYVERVVAKVTLRGFDYDHTGITIGTNTYKYTKQIDDANSAFDDDYVAFEGWALNVTNNSFKPVRDVSALSTWLGTIYGVTSRFLENDPVETQGNQYRIYWAIDGNYNGSLYGENPFTIYSGTNYPTWKSDMEHQENGDNFSAPLYCFENTMDYNQQYRGQTTGVILKTKYWLTKPKNSESAATANQSFFMYGDIAKTYTESEFLSAVKTAANALLTGDDATEQFGEGEPIINTNAVGGSYDNSTGRTMADLFKRNANDVLTTKQAAAIWNAIGTIKYYKNGDSYYYTTLIQHFDHATEVSLTNGDNYSEKHLGRYGVVRNNWYELNITSISGPGEPEIEEPDPDDPDDSTEGYIRAEINVLSWAKRSQNVEL